MCVLISSTVASKNGYRTACHRLVRFSVLCDLSFRYKLLGGQYFILESISFPVDIKLLVRLTFSTVSDISGKKTLVKKLKQSVSV